MKHRGLLLSLLLSGVIFYALSNTLGAVPPLGKFLNPHTGIWQNETNETVAGEVTIPGLNHRVTVHYDAQMIPHVFAQNEHDLYKAQGYLTAKHRLWQVDSEEDACTL